MESKKQPNDNVKLKENKIKRREIESNVLFDPPQIVVVKYRSRLAQTRTWFD